MSTHAHTFDIASLALHQAQLAQRQPLPALPVWVYRLAGPLRILIAKQFEKKAQQIASMGIWFDGAIVALANEPSDILIDADGNLVSIIERLESLMLHMRGELLELVRSIGTWSGSRTSLVRAALRQTIAANSEAFESVQKFRWAVLEHDADVDMHASRVSPTFASAEDLIASLHR